MQQDQKEEELLEVDCYHVHYQLISMWIVVAVSVVIVYFDGIST